MISDNVNLQDELVFKGWARQVAEALTSEDWHEIGATGEPAFQNSWVNASGRTTKFYKQLDRVYIEGSVTTGTGVAFTLPEGYRPDEQLSYTNITINTNGDVTPSTATSLDGISFRT